jgi:hypothetical protein
MIVLSITVAFWIIQMSDIDRAMSEAAIAINSPVSALNFRGIRMPLILKKIIYKLFTL